MGSSVGYQEDSLPGCNHGSSDGADSSYHLSLYRWTEANFREDTGVGQDQVQRQEGTHRYESCLGYRSSYYLGGISYLDSGYPGNRSLPAWQPVLAIGIIGRNVLPLPIDSAIYQG